MMNIPYQNMEIEQIYAQILADPQRAIALCAANSGEGVTSLALALAQRNLLAGHSTLVVDLNLYRPALRSLLNIDACLSAEKNSAVLPVNSNTAVLTAPQLVTTKYSALAVTGITAPLQRENLIKLRQPGTLEQCIKEWMQHFDTVLIDTSPLNRVNAQNIPPQRVAAACDGALLVVLAGQTSETMISSAVQKLTTTNAQLLGCVFNDRDNPSLKNELLREVQRMNTNLSWLSRHLKRIINNNRLLTLEI